jgi:antiviral helicase SKI2
MKEGVGLLAELVHEWTTVGNIPEVDWSRMRSLEFQETLRDRNALMHRVTSTACVLCGEFEEHVRTQSICLPLLQC